MVTSGPLNTDGSFISFHVYRFFIEPYRVSKKEKKKKGLLLEWCQRLRQILNQKNNKSVNLVTIAGFPRQGRISKWCYCASNHTTVMCHTPTLSYVVSCNFRDAEPMSTYLFCTRIMYRMLVYSPGKDALVLLLWPAHTSIHHEPHVLNAFFFFFAFSCKNASLGYYCFNVRWLEGRC